MNARELLAVIVIGFGVSSACAPAYLTGRVPQPPPRPFSHASETVSVVLRADPRVVVSALDASYSPVQLELPLQDLAERVAGDAGLRVVRLDEDPDLHLTTRPPHDAVDLIPGTYSVEWGKRFAVSHMIDATMSIDPMRQAELALKPGHVYRLGADRTTGPGYTVFLWIEDVTQREVVSGNPRAPLFIVGNPPAERVHRAYPGPERDRASIARVFLGDADWLRTDGLLRPAAMQGADCIIELSITTMPTPTDFSVVRALHILGFAATLGIVPIWQHHEIELTAEVRRRGETDSRTYRANGQITEFIQMPFTFLPMGSLLYPRSEALLVAFERLQRTAFEEMRFDQGPWSPETDSQQTGCSATQSRVAETSPLRLPTAREIRAPSRGLGGEVGVQPDRRARVPGLEGAAVRAVLH